MKYDRALRVAVSGIWMFLLFFGVSHTFADMNPVALDEFKEVNPRARFYGTFGDDQDQSERIGTVNAIYGTVLTTGRTPIESAWNHVDQLDGIFAMEIGELVPAVQASGNVLQGVMPDPVLGTPQFYTFRFDQVYGGVPVFRSGIGFLVRNEENNPLVMSGSNLKEMVGFQVDQLQKAVVTDAMRQSVIAMMDSGRGLDPVLQQENETPLVVSDEELVIWAGVGVADVGPEMAVVFMATRGSVRTWPDYQKSLVVASTATGEVLHSEDQIHHVDVTGNVSGRATDGLNALECDPESAVGLPYAEAMVLGGNSTFADANGDFVIPHGGSSQVSVESPLRGQFFEVFDQSAGGATPQLSMLVTPPGPADFLHNPVDGQEFETANVNAYVEANVVRDYVLSYEPTFPTIANQTFFDINTNINSTCNAFYDGSSINFYRNGGGCNNTSFSDIVYHEYAHHLIAVTGNGQGQMGEGAGDVMGVLIEDDPLLGNGFQSCGLGIRTADNSYQYPCSGSIHDCGQLLSGCVWSLRNELIVTEPANYRDIGTSLFLGMLIARGQLAPGSGTIDPLITIIYLELDDTDGDIGNGTPHYSEIAAGFGLHNMDAPPLDLIDFNFPSGLPDRLLDSGGTTVRVEVIGVAGTPDPGSGMLHVDGGGGFSAIPMSVVSENVYDAVFPAFPCGTNVRYYFSAEADSGVVGTFPDDAPQTALEVLVATTITTGFADDFEVDIGWSVSGNALDGQWVRGVPAGDGTRGDPTTDGDGSGRCYLTDNVAGNSDVDDGATVLTSPIMDATSRPGIPYVTYSRWYSNNTGNAPEADVFVVEASNDGGSTWTSIETVGPAGPEVGGGWLTKSFNLLDFLTPTNNLRIRFTASDLGDPSIVEAGVDGVRLRFLVCGLPIPPTIACPGDLTLQCPADTDPASTGMAMAVDNCDGSTNDTSVTWTDEVTPGCGVTKTIARTWLATDICGNTSACVQTITVVDTTPPAISCPGDVTVECTVDASDPANTGGSAGAMDTCDDDPAISSSDAVAAGSCPQEMTISRTWTATDACGNTNQCVQTITVVDTEGPVVTGDVPPNRTSPCELIPLPPKTIAAEDACDPSVTGLTYDGETSTPGACPQEFTLVRTWSAADACGNPTSVSQTIVVVDNTPPVIAGVGPDVTLECVGAELGGDAVTATDSCAGDIVPVLSEDSNKGSGCLGDPLIITRTWTATDPCGNASSSSRTITVEDTEAPVLSGVPASITVECGPVPDAPEVTATDNCPNVVLAFFESQTRGNCPQQFVVTRRWEATDACGQVTEGVQTVTVNDTTAPSVGGPPADVTVECDAIPLPPRTLPASDACDDTVSEATLHDPQIKAGPCAGTYSMIRSWTAVDACGNGATVSQTITVVDTTPPVISAPADITVECDQVPDPPKSVDATDTCGEVVVTANDTQVEAGPCQGALTMTRSWTAVDACGNEATASQTITVVDTTPPAVAKPPADETLECSDPLPPLPKSLSAFDLCDDDVVAATLNKPVMIAGACPQEFTMIRSWTATDGCGNSTTVSQTLTVVDTTPPAPLKGAVPPDRTADCQLIPDAPRSIPAADDCDESVTEFTYDGETSEPGACPQEYTLARTWSGSDSCGNAASVSQTIVVVDTTPPALVGSIGDLTLSCPGDIPDLASVTAIDNCAAAEDLTVESSETSNKGAGCPGDPLVITRTFTATDPCGNGITLVQTITVVDDEAPVLAGVPKSHSVECGAIPDAADVTASDNCSGVILVFDEVTDAGPCDATVTVTRTWTATDACGNVTEATQVITSVDDTPPTIEGVSGDVTVSCSGDVPRLDEVTVTDDCADPDAIDVDASETTNKGAGCPNDPLVLTRSYTATDPCGNVATATQTVTVIDDTSPTLVGVPASTRVSCDAVPTPADVTVIDNCPGASVAYSETLTAGACEDTYTLTRTWIATDACGNEVSASQEITVSDLTAPVVTGCDEGLSARADAGTCEAEVSWAAPDVTDNCDPAPSVTYDIDLDDDGSVDVAGHPSTTYTFLGGTHRVTAVATDRCGNADDSCTFLVEVSAFNEVLLDIGFAGTVASPLTRCITFEFWSCGGETVEVVEQSILFIAGVAEGVSVLVPCGEYDCLTARDTLHTLARTDDDFAAAGSIYVADFADDDLLVGGNANNDETIDILDFGVFVTLFGQPGGGSGCPAEGPDADFNGDGTVNTPDYTFIANNFFVFADPGCCPGAAAAEVSDPLIAISVANLWKRGLGHLTPADLNADGWLDAEDVALFGDGVRPDHRVATLAPDVETAWWTDASTWTLGLIPGESTIVVLERGTVELRQAETYVRSVEIEAGAWLTVSTGAWLTADDVVVHAGGVLELTGDRTVLSTLKLDVQPGGRLIVNGATVDVPVDGLEASKSQP